MANLAFTLQTLRKNNPGVLITQGYLRADFVLLAAQGSINWAIVQQQSIVSAKEQRLKMSDGFCVTAIAVKLYKTADTAVPTTAANVGKAIDYSYPQPAVFSASTEAARLENIFNGFLQITIDKAVVYPQFPGYKFRRVNNAQLGTTTAAIAGPVQYLQGAEEQAGVNNGFAALEATINLKGNQDIQFQMNPTSNFDGTGTSSLNICSIILDGFLLQNGGVSGYNFKELE